MPKKTSTKRTKRTKSTKSTKSSSNYRSSITGRFVTESTDRRHPKETEKTRSRRGRPPRTGTDYRSTITGHFVTAATNRRHPKETVKEGARRVASEVSHLVRQVEAQSRTAKHTAPKRKRKTKGLIDRVKDWFKK